MLSMLPGTMTLVADQRGALQRLHLRELRGQRLHGVFSVLMPVTVLICAIWLVTWALSIGLSGSWFCICATSSFRKVSALTVEFAALEAAGVELTMTSGVDVAALTLMASFLQVVSQLPSWMVLSSSVLAVFMTSRLFWYEREAEIMLTISSTALTLL